MKKIIEFINIAIKFFFFSSIPRFDSIQINRFSRETHILLVKSNFRAKSTRNDSISRRVGRFDYKFNRTRGDFSRVVGSHSARVKRGEDPEAESGNSRLCSLGDIPRSFEIKWTGSLASSTLYNIILVHLDSGRGCHGRRFSPILSIFRQLKLSITRCINYALITGYIFCKADPD